MIVRILGEGQLEVPDGAVDELSELDRQLDAAVESEDEAAFRPALAALLAKVRQAGSPAKPDELRPSELIVPHDDATMADVRKLLTDEGLIPG